MPTIYWYPVTQISENFRLIKLTSCRNYSQGSISFLLLPANRKKAPDGKLGWQIIQAYHSRTW
jgi:hypothetical protein